MEIAIVLGYYLLVAIAISGLIFRARLRAWWIRLRLKSARMPPGAIEPPLLANRLLELDKIFGPFGSNAAHPSALYAQAKFVEAADLLAASNVPLAVVLQYVEGNSWSLASVALAALRKRTDRAAAIDRVLIQCEHLSPWAMYFALQVIAEAQPAIPVGVPVVRAKDWWIDNRWMPNIFRDYFELCATRGDPASFGSALKAVGTAPHDVIRRFLQHVTHPSATALIEELDAAAALIVSPAAAPAVDPLALIGRYWSDNQGLELLVEPDHWRDGLALAASTLAQRPPRSLLVAGEPDVGKSSFLRLLARRMAHERWTVFEASGADLQADQIYIGQLEGRIRKVVEELAKRDRVIWYIPDIVQVAMSGRHFGQSATMLDQIVPAIAGGRLVVWAEAAPKGVARLVQMRPSLRGLFETVIIEPMSPAETRSLAGAFIAELAAKTSIRFDPECADVALDTARQYLGTNGLPGTALHMLKLAAVRAEHDQIISPRQVLETLSQLSGLPLSILDTREHLDLATVRAFFAARVMGQDEAVEATVARIAMLKAGLNDPGKPIGVFLFAGPTGTGKTELAKAACEFLFGSVERMIRLDMSEFQTHESIAKILGQTSTTVVETESLVSRVRKQPFSVLLLDEFEKSHPMIWDLFLQAFDEGRLTDAAGQVADLRHCLIILTSNLGATAHRSLGLGFAPQRDEFSKDQVTRAIAQTYRPEFQNRLDKVIVFQPLTRDLMRGILKKELLELLERRGLKDRAWAIEWESSALEFLLERGFSPEMGARPLKRAIDQYVVAPLAAIIVERRFPEGEQFLFVRSDGDGIQVEFVDPDADEAEEQPAAAPVEPTELSKIAAAILTPKGVPAEIQLLQAECEAIERTLASGEWNELKQTLSGEMAAADFWTRADRFGILARFALMDRVKTAAETASALRGRMARYRPTPRHHPAQLSGRFALQLHLIREGIKDVFDDAPVEVALAIEPALDGAGEHWGTLAWCERLMSMYRAWGAKRRMHIRELSRADEGKNGLILTVSGFGAYRTLIAEAGLHVFEPSESASGRVTARVSLAVVPLGDVPAAKERKSIVQALEQAPRENTVARRYREQPPLVRSGNGKWRSGRLDLVLGGDFDLLQAGAI